MIIWGTRRTEANLGFVADFCPICRETQAFRLVRLGLTTHLYGLSIGKGRLTGFERICTTCNTALEADPKHYTEIQKKYPLAHIPASHRVSHLTDQSNPELRVRYADRLALEYDIRQGNQPSDVHQRKQLIREPFLILAPSVERKLSETRIDLPMLATLALIPVVLFGTFVMLDQFATAQKEELIPMIMAGLCLVATIIVIVQGRMTTHRYLRTHVYPHLGRALYPLRPKLDELDQAISELRQLGFQLGKRSTPTGLIAFVTPR